MTEQEKIRRLAEWMGWKEDLQAWFEVDEKGNSIALKFFVIDWNPYTSRDHAGQLIQRARSLGWHYEVGDNHIKAEYYCLIYGTYSEDRKEVWGYGTTEEQAICEAILRLMEGRKNHNRCPDCGGIVGSFSAACNSGQHTRNA